jgi:hypothetical protein
MPVNRNPEHVTVLKNSLHRTICVKMPHVKLWWNNVSTYNTSVKSECVWEAGRTFQYKLQDPTIPNRRTIHAIINKWRHWTKWSWIKMLSECKSFTEDTGMCAKQWAVFPLSAATLVSFVMCKGSWCLITPSESSCPSWRKMASLYSTWGTRRFLGKLSGDCNEPSHKTDCKNKIVTIVSAS